MKLYKKLGYVKQEEYDKLQKNYNHLQQEFRRRLEKKYTDYEEVYCKIADLVSDYESIRYNLQMKSEYSIIPDSIGSIFVTEQVPTFAEFMKDFISELNANEKLTFYEEIKPILLKHIKNEKKLKQLDLCIKPIKSFKFKLKKNGI